MELIETSLFTLIPLTEGAAQLWEEHTEVTVDKGLLSNRLSVNVILDPVSKPEMSFTSDWCQGTY